MKLLQDSTKSTSLLEDKVLYDKEDATILFNRIESCHIPESIPAMESRTMDLLGTRFELWIRTECGLTTLMVDFLLSQVASAASGERSS